MRFKFIEYERKQVKQSEDILRPVIFSLISGPIAAIEML